jgi:threonine dehydrogenase-like Zn-dependent dehydrogenase
MTTSKAAIWKGKFHIDIEQLPIPEVADDGLLLKNEANGICGTDGHLIEQDPPYPAIMCHEIAGKIETMGANANKSLNVYGGPLKEGDRIVLYPWITCGKCEGCRTHRPGTCTTCADSFVYGVPYSMLGLGGAEPINSRVDEAPYLKGGFSEYTYVFPETYVWKIPDDMPSEIAVLMDPMAVAVRSIEMAQTSPGIVEEGLNTNSKVVVIGAGQVGILAAAYVRALGAEQIIMVGGRSERLRVAKELGQVDEVIDIHSVSPADRIKQVQEMTGGGANVVLQCANSVKAFGEGLEMLARLGTLIETGNMVNQGETIAIDPAKMICAKHARILGMSANNPQSFNRAFNFLKRHKTIPFHKIYSHRTNLDGLLDTLRQKGNDDYVKGLVLPS